MEILEQDSRSPELLGPIYNSFTTNMEINTHLFSEDQHTAAIFIHSLLELEGIIEAYNSGND